MGASLRLSRFIKVGSQIIITEKTDNLRERIGACDPTCGFA